MRQRWVLSFSELQRTLQLAASPVVSAGLSPTWRDSIMSTANTIKPAYFADDMLGNFRVLNVSRMERTHSPLQEHHISRMSFNSRAQIKMTMLNMAFPPVWKDSKSTSLCFNHQVCAGPCFTRMWPRPARTHCILLTSAVSIDSIVQSHTARSSR